MASGQAAGARAWVPAWHGVGRGPEFRALLPTWFPNFSSAVLSVAGGTSRTRCTTPGRDQQLVGCVALSQGALTWEQLALTPALPEARDAE